MRYYEYCVVITEISTGKVTRLQYGTKKLAEEKRRQFKGDKRYSAIIEEVIA